MNNIHNEEDWLISQYEQNLDNDIKGNKFDQELTSLLKYYNYKTITIDTVEHLREDLYNLYRKHGFFEQYKPVVDDYIKSILGLNYGNPRLLSLTDRIEIEANNRKGLL